MGSTTPQLGLLWVVDPATRAFLGVLRRLNPGAYWRARAEARAQVDELIGDAIPGSTDRPADFDGVLDRLDLDGRDDGPET